MTRQKSHAFDSEKVGRYTNVNKTNVPNFAFGSVPMAVSTMLLIFFE